MNYAEEPISAPQERGAELPPTERRLEDSRELDNMSALEILTLMNAQDRIAVDAVNAVLPQIAQLVEIGAERLACGGRIHYFGAGTSGRLGVLDAAELLPTFSIEPDVVIAHMAGGEAALVRAVENSEDSEPEGVAAAATLGPDDLAIGLTASGNTPYVAGALRAARAAGAHTALISCNPRATVANLADSHIVLQTGAEVVTGSTRLKAGSAEKMVLNGFSTALMVAYGRTWSNLMVSLVATNAKLRDRTLRILADATGAQAAECEALLRAANGDLKVAIVAAIGDMSTDAARKALDVASGSVRGALEANATLPASLNSNQTERQQ